MAGGQFFAQFGSGSNLYAVGGLNYLGTWNASTNTPTIASGVGSTGDYYVVSVAGTTNIDGISDWDIGDWIIFNGTAWQKIDNSDQVTSVNGLQGAVSIGLDSVLAQNNTTGLNDISVNSGQSIIFNNNTFTGTLQEGTYTGNQVYTLPDATGTIALTSDPSGAIYLNDLADVTTGLPVPTSIVDDGRLLYYSSTQSKWITKEEITFATIVLDAKKDTAGTIPKGTPVYLAGFDSDVITIEEADASDPNKMNVIGVSVEPINDTDADKHILKFGKLTGLDTTGTPYGEVWNEGDILWVASGGGFTKTRPTGNTTIQRIAQVLRVDATGGQLEIFNTWRSAGLPNLAQNKTWVGDASGYPVETDISTFDQNLSQVLGVGNVTGGQNIIADSDSVFRTNNATALNRMALQLFNDATDYMALGSDLFAPNIKGGSVQLYNNSLYIGVYEGVGQLGVSLQFNEGVKRVELKRNNIASSSYDFLINGSGIDFKLSGASGSGQGLLKPTPLTADRTYTLQDASGTLAFLSDIPSTPNLSSVLAVGNTTGGNNIVVSANQSIQSANVTQTNRFAISFFDGGGSADTLVIQRDSAGEGGSIVLNESALISRRFDNLGNEMYTELTSLGWQVGSDTATDYVFDGNISLKIRRTFDANFNPTTLTANRTYTFQDASGTIAFLSDIPSNAGDTLYVADGSLTGNRTIDTTANKYNVIFENTSTGDAIVIDASNRTILYSDGTFGGNLRTNIITANRIWDLPNASGTIALLSDIPSTPSLSSVLAVGNTTGANNILINSGQDIRSNTSGNTLNLDDPFAQVGNSAFSITQDNGTYGADTGWLYVESNNGSQLAYQLGNSPLEAIGIGIYADNVTPNIFTGKEVVISDNRTSQGRSGNIDKRATLIAVNGGIINTGIVNTAIVGGTNITASVNNALYTNQLRLQSSANNFDGILDIPTLTADRTYTLQDGSGTLAFLSDITTPNLNAVLGAGNSTSGRDIRLSNGDWIETDNTTASNRMTITSVNGSGNPDAITIRRLFTGFPAPIPQPTAQVVFSDDITLGVLENNGYSRMQFTTNGDILFASANPTKNFTIDDSYQFRLQVGGSFCNLNASGNATLTFPTGTGTIALTSDYQTGQTYTPTNVVTDRSFDADSTTLNEIADVLGTLITDLQSVNILS